MYLCSWRLFLSSQTVQILMKCHVLGPHCLPRYAYPKHKQLTNTNTVSTHAQGHKFQAKKKYSKKVDHKKKKLLHSISVS